jgi:hypothetical protein
MNRQRLLGVLLFGALWGLSEALLGGWLYGAGLRGSAPIVLSVIAVGILTVARVIVPLAGSSTAIGALAVAFKALNTEFACHLLAIFLLGASFDLVWSVARGRWKPLIGPAATYLGFALFALIITYVIRYSWWTIEGWPKVLRYIVFTGSITAACNALVVPAGGALARRLAGRASDRAWLRPWTVRAAATAAAGLWAFAIAHRF